MGLGHKTEMGGKEKGREDRKASEERKREKEKVKYISTPIRLIGRNHSAGR